MASIARTVGPPAAQHRARLVVLVSGSGTTLQALLDASDLPAEVVAVGADRHGIEGLRRAERAGIPTFVETLQSYAARDGWDGALTDQIASFRPDMVILAGFMKLVSPGLLARFPDRVFNTHPALCPSFPGVHGPSDALRYGVTVTGTTLFIVDAGTDSGPIVAQSVVPVESCDDAVTLHERIKVAERAMLVEHIALLASTGWTIHESPQRRKVTIP